MASVVPAGVKAVMFNLGYYPSGDKSIITQPDTTLRALEAALDLLVPEGIVTVVIYPGHPGGAEEADRIKAWLAGLPPERYRTVHYGIQGRPGGSPPPYLLAIERER